ncbi:seminase-like [Cochliomyia hominivorax]
MEASLIIRTYLFILLPVIAAFHFKNKRKSENIVGGTKTLISRAKFVVNVRSNHGKFECGGTLVAPTFVITAAHCVNRFKESDLSVIGGATYLSDKGIQSGVSKIYIPEDFDIETANMDIAVLELLSPLEGENIETIKLCETHLKGNDKITIFGWGQTSEYIAKHSEELRMVRFPVIDHSRCKDMYIEQITKSMFCAGGLGNKDACIGDSGGPAVFRNQLCGVISWGRGCARHYYSGIYTDIMYARNFIDQSMKRVK